MPDDGRAVLARLAGVLGMTPKDVATRSGCATPRRRSPAGTARRTSRSPSPTRPPPSRRCRSASGAEDFPGITAEPTAVRRYPAPVRVEHRPGARLPRRRSPTRRSSEAEGHRLAVPARPTRSAAPDWSAATTRRCAARRASPATRWTTSAGSSARPRATQAAVRLHLVTSIDSRVQAVTEQELHEAMKEARKQHDREHRHATTRPTPAPSVVMESKTGRIVAMAVQPDVRPERLGRRHLRRRTTPSSPARSPTTRCSTGPSRARPRPARPSRSSPPPPPCRRGTTSTAATRAPSSYNDRRPGLQELRGRELRRDQPRAGAGGLLRHRLLPLAHQRVEEGRRDQAQEERRRTGSTSPRTSSVSARRPASTCPTRSPAAFRTASGSRTTGEANKDAWCKDGKKDGTYARRSPYENCLDGYKMRAGDSRQLLDRPGRHARHADPGGRRSTPRRSPTAGRCTTRPSARP